MLDKYGSRQPAPPRPRPGDATARDGRRPQPLRAMTLVEVLVASVLLGVGVAGLLSAASLGLRHQRRAEQRAIALYLAQEKLAGVEGIGPNIWALGHPTRGTELRGGVAYDWTIEIEQQAVGALFSVRVEVTWPAPGGGGSVASETWLNDYEAQALMPPAQPEETTPGAGNVPPRE